LSNFVFDGSGDGSAVEDSRHSILPELSYLFRRGGGRVS
jgi:hypothetical protein